MIKNNHKYWLILLLLVGVTFGFTALSEKKLVANETATKTVPKESSETEQTNFDIMMKVLVHKRCVNCHPSDEHPRQGEDMHVHNFGVQRGPDDHGVASVKCSTCHQEENNNYSGVPGAPEWALAPLKMRWMGLSRVEIAKSILNPEKNNGRTLEETVKHLTEHKLVLWAWNPGVDSEGNPREKPPVPKEEYIAAVKAWAAEGAPIPEE